MNILSRTVKKGECLEWTGAIRGKSGYGCVKIEGKVFSTHRISYEQNIGEIPEGKMVLHTCDNRKCVNPKHLFTGNNSDNMKDAYRKHRVIPPVGGQFKKGIEHPFLKLKDEEIEAIKMLKKDGYSLRKLGRMFNVDHTRIWQITRSKK